MNTPYERIKNYCETKELSKLQQSILLNKFYENYNAMIAEYKKGEGKDPDQNMLEAYETALLSDTNIQNNIKLVNEEIENAFKDRLKLFKLTTSFKEFSISVLSGVIGSFIFTLLLVLFLRLGQNQIKSWIADWYVNDVQIENMITAPEDIPAK